VFAALTCVHFAVLFLVVIEQATSADGGGRRVRLVAIDTCTSVTYYRASRLPSTIASNHHYHSACQPTRRRFLLCGSWDNTKVTAVERRNNHASANFEGRRCPFTFVAWKHFGHLDVELRTLTQAKSTNTNQSPAPRSFCACHTAPSNFVDGAWSCTHPTSTSTRIRQTFDFRGFDIRHSDLIFKNISRNFHVPRVF